MESPTRVEHDSMGAVLVPADALWGAQTQRAVQNFPVSGEKIGRDMIAALAALKGAAAVVNGSLGVLDADMAAAISDAAAEVSRGGPVPGGLVPGGLVPGGWRCIPTITSTRRSRPTTCSRPRFTSRPAR
jgi:hypothetical protein